MRAPIGWPALPRYQQNLLHGYPALHAAPSSLSPYRNGARIDGNSGLYGNLYNPQNPQIINNSFRTFGVHPQDSHGLRMLDSKVLHHSQNSQIVTEDAYRAASANDAGPPQPLRFDPAMNDRNTGEATHRSERRLNVGQNGSGGLPRPLFYHH